MGVAFGGSVGVAGGGVSAKCGKGDGAHSFRASKGAPNGLPNDDLTH